MKRIYAIIYAMEKRDLKISIAHLYPKHLNLYGDMGNIIALTKRCEWRNIKVDYYSINPNEEIPEADLYFIGGGQDNEQITVAPCLYKHKNFLLEQREKGSVFLGICGGYQLLGHYYAPFEGEKLLGVGLLDAFTVAGNKRFIGNVTAHTDFLSPKTLVGFENHAGLTYLQGDTKPLAKVEVGNGNNGEDGSEGARFMNVFGTYLHGSLLPKNSHFADYLLSLALEKKYGEPIDLSKLDDKIEIDAHNSVVGKAY